LGRGRRRHKKKCFLEIAASLKRITKAASGKPPQLLKRKRKKTVFPNIKKEELG